MEEMDDMLLEGIKEGSPILREEWKSKSGASDGTFSFFFSFFFPSSLLFGGRVEVLVIRISIKRELSIPQVVDTGESTRPIRYCI